MRVLTNLTMLISALYFLNCTPDSMQSSNLPNTNSVQTIANLDSTVHNENKKYTVNPDSTLADFILEYYPFGGSNIEIYFTESVTDCKYERMLLNISFDPKVNNYKVIAFGYCDEEFTLQTFNIGLYGPVKFGALYKTQFSSQENRNQ